MIIYLDSEGTPVQEFSALYVNEKTYEIVDIFHHHVKYPSHFTSDMDYFARCHIHGLNREYLLENGLDDEATLVTLFHTWLKNHPYNSIYGHAPFKEKQLLSLSILDVQLPEWKFRELDISHNLTISLKNNKVPICGMTCNAHTSFRGWKPKRLYAISPTDYVKMNFNFHCSMYDCVECYLFHLSSLE